VRRISAAFKDIPGGQVLGPSLDYSHRLLRLDVLDANAPRDVHHAKAASDDGGRASGPAAPTGQKEDETAENIDEHSILHGALPPVAEWQRANGLLAPLPDAPMGDSAELPDVTREPVRFPAPRAHRLQSLARADTGGVLALGYASMRGYGLAHPTVNELRLGFAEVVLTHPVTGESFSAGRVRVSQCEVVNTQADTLRLGFAATLGWNEVKVIAGAMLDLEMDAPTPHPAHTEDFVLYHTEAVEASGFCIHYKLPHYVTFQSGLDALRGVRAGQGTGETASGRDDEREEERR
jgi:alpha-D-ribose 1-methylphosphonate 5-triphosphate synthase subunit PhnI